ncbi:sigma-70 family RNA polymerase sigma factor, partial [Streptomyces lonarensis]
MTEEREAAVGSPGPDPGPCAVERERGRLTGMAHRMLGTVSEAEEAVQEAYLRWYRLDRADRERVTNPAAWLTRVTSRICLDLLGSARARRERYVGPWLPEPVPEGAFPGAGGGWARSVAMAPAAEQPPDRVVVDEEVGTALLVVMESMTPAERVVFVLHDVFAVPFAEIALAVGRTPAATRQLARSARARLGSARRAPADRAEHARVVAA